MAVAKAIAADNSGAVNGAWSRLEGGYCAAKVPSPHQTLCEEGDSAPTEATHTRQFKANPPCAVSPGEEVATMVESPWQPLTA